MASLLSQLKDDIRFSEGLSACMNCGICTAVCPAAAYFDYDPRRICQLVQTGDEQDLENLLKGEEIWMCGQCLSCKARCPRGNVPGYLIQALRKLSQQSGHFIHSREGRKQIRLKRRIGHSILETGYCVHPQMVEPETHPEQGPVWVWVLEQGADLYRRCGSNYYGEGEGGLRKMAPGVLDELEAIFEETGGLRFWEAIERGAEELKLNTEP